MTPLLKRLLTVAMLALGLSLAQVQTAAACGGLVAPNGAIRLSRATTLVAWHDGIEHYMTSFTYQGDVSNLGWIVPLPAVPLKIEEGGAWTLQRLSRETHPIPATFDLRGAAPSAASAEVLQQVKVEALNITVLRGTGQAVLDWCAANNFALDDETRHHLLVYAQGSPIFMAAKYDTAAAQARHQLQGDGAPVLITMKTEHPWVPLEVLALDGQRVQADLYLLTDTPVNTSDVAAVAGQSAVGSEIPGAPGFTVAFQERMNATLYHDLSTDRNMGWVRPDSWLTYLSLDAPDTAVTYDLGVSTQGVIRIAPFGTPPMAVVDGVRSHELPSWLPHLPLGTPQVVLALLILAVFGGGILLLFRWTGRTQPATNSLAKHERNPEGEG
jgi:hypothetical protein